MHSANLQSATRGMSLTAIRRRGTTTLETQGHGTVARQFKRTTLAPVLALSTPGRDGSNAGARGAGGGGRASLTLKLYNGTFPYNSLQTRPQGFPRPEPLQRRPRPSGARTLQGPPRSLSSPRPCAFPPAPSIPEDRGCGYLVLIKTEMVPG